MHTGKAVTGQELTIVEQWQEGDVTIAVWSDGKRTMGTTTDKAIVITPAARDKRQSQSHSQACTGAPADTRSNVP